MINPSRSCKQCAGFTIVELLVVAAILSVLTAILSVNYNGALERADAAASQSNLRTVFTALYAYRADYNRFPLADGIADSRSRPDATAWGCGPAANGYWSGVPLLLAELNYCPVDALYDPALKRIYRRPIEAYPSCSDSSFSGKMTPQWRFLRYAYNHAALDVGGSIAGAHNIERDVGDEVWLARSLHVDVAEFNPERGILFPYRIKPSSNDHSLFWYGEFELTLGGAIRPRPVQIR